MSQEILKIQSLNCRGLRNKTKRYDVFNYLKNLKADIICLQDTHLIESDWNECRNLWGGEVILHGQRTNARGVAILINTTFEYKIIRIEKDNQGNAIILDLKIQDIILRLITIYGPNSDDVTFYNNINQQLLSNEEAHILWCGDFNMCLNPALDSHNYVNINNPNARSHVLDIMSEHNLIDLYRYFHPDTKRFTWRRYKPLKQARLDYFIGSNSLIDLTDSIHINPGYRTDHSMLEVNIKKSNFIRGKGIWKFNTSLLVDQEYLKLINLSIDDEVKKYAAPSKNNQILSEIPVSDIRLTITDDLFLEMILLRIRGETIKYSSKQKRLKDNQENRLLSEIQSLEQAEDIPENQNTIRIKQQELLNIRENRMKGHFIRSRVQWLQMGEKPSKYFCSLEKQNCINKTLKKVRKADGTMLTDQKEILNEFKLFYQKLFKSNENQTEYTNLENLMGSISINKLTDAQAISLEGDLKIEELNVALKNMKNGKTPGIDGLPAEFLKVFWNKIKFWILRALNYSFKSGTMPLTLRQCIITCLPKPGKQRELLSNWRPLSMLSVIYKLASASIANRIKPYLEQLINKEQTGFIPGRFIGESTRLIYNLMHYTEKMQIPGMLMIIDFRKAFDSISWSFIYKTLSLMGFTEDFIKWIKLFNNNIKATVIQSGFTSEFFTINRGCRQGDPISPYLFILVAQILNSLILNNPEIKGIQVKETEFKMSQFADDTTLILNGTQDSLSAALNTLEQYGTLSGLKVNTEKTKIIWIGKKRFSTDKLIPRSLDWNTSKFNLLGINFSVNLQEMVELNFSEKITEIRKSVSHWNKRYLTPLGKVTVIKSIFLSKLNHLFSSLPNPESSWLDNLNDIFFRFLWSNKPDKINRDVAVLEICKGGLKMIKLEYVVMASKITWIGRLLNGSSPWINLF